ncbi:MAG: hypothetical protein CMJ14_04045 [Pelagibacterales bacterium]|nr:hypothetical protein [Pelagibacterales bacterium]|tara:strand:+ start:625 stop:831 length:207 start_codon:yes stop_codon:yes gene_type:complete
MQIIELILPYLIYIFLFAVFIVLATGIISMLRGGDFNKKWGNKLMRARVILQAIAVLLIVLLGIIFSR